MTIASLQQELTRWEREVEVLEDECTAAGWNEPERLLATVQKTLGVYRGRILPRLGAEHDLALPALPDENAARAAVAAYDAVLDEELTRLVNQLEDQRRDLIRDGQTAEERLRIAETLAALRVLTRVALRFGAAVAAAVAPAVAPAAAVAGAVADRTRKEG